MNHTHESEPNLRLADDLPALSEREARLMEDALDRLGTAEGRSAPSGLTERVLAATRSHLGPRVAARIDRGGAAAAGRAWLTPLRAAAALALAATVGIAVMAARSEPPARVARAEPPPGVPQFERDIELWVAIADAPAGDLAAQLSTLSADTAALRDNLAANSGTVDLWSEEGAM